MRRRFTKSQRDVLFVAADGKSALSGEPLQEHWQTAVAYQGTCEGAILTRYEKGKLVESLWRVVDHGGTALEQVPRFIRRVIESEAWKEREQDGEVYRNGSLAEFIMDKPFKGCGWSLEKVEALLRDDPTTLALWREALKHQGKAGNLGNNITEAERVTGTSASYTLSRLKRERLDLFDRVVAGELSANAAAIEAGFWERTVAVPIDPEGAAKIIARHFKPRQIEQLIEWLGRRLRGKDGADQIHQA